LTRAQRDAGSNPAERSRLDRLRTLVASGVSGIPELLSMRTDASWSVRREVIAALGELGEPALAALGAARRAARAAATRIAATGAGRGAAPRDGDTRR
jgi:hypothetical protein